MLFTKPDGPDPLPINWLHRGNDGLLTLSARPSPAAWEDICSVPARDVVDVIPALKEQLDRDSFFSINSFWRGSRRRSCITSPAGEVLPGANRKRVTIRWLTAAFTDLDCHKLNLSEGATVGALIDAQNSNLVPPVSLLFCSGRGVWAFWMLRGENERPQQPCVRAWKDALHTYHLIQRELVGRLGFLGADAGAMDVSRVCRIPGSVNSKASKRATYWLPTDAAGQPFVYTLADLAAALGVGHRGDSHDQGSAIENETSARSKTLGRLGQAARWRKSLLTFERLLKLRGHIPEGVRATAAWVYGFILRGMARFEITDDELVSSARELYPFFSQPPIASTPFTYGEFFEALKASATPTFRHIRNQTFADKLAVTPDEARVLEHWPCSAVFGDGTDDPQLSRKAQSKARRDMLAAWCKGKAVPTLTSLSEQLEAHGLPATLETIRRYMAALKIVNPRSRRRRGT